MAFRSKHTSPVDRAVADLEHQIQTLEQQIYKLDVASSSPSSPPATRSLAESVKEALRPPSRRRTTRTKRERYDLFEAPADPLQELQIESATNFFHEPPGNVAAITRTSTIATSQPKLAQLLNAGTFRTQKPVLKHVQRKNQKQFFMWLSLAFLVLCLFVFILR
jgi:hypothetical protein